MYFILVCHPNTSEVMCLMNDEDTDMPIKYEHIEDAWDFCKKDGREYIEPCEIVTGGGA